MSLSTLLQNTQGTTSITPTKPTVSTGGGLGKLVSTAQPNTPQKVQAPSIKENPAGTGYPAMNVDGTPVTPVSTPTPTFGQSVREAFTAPREAQTLKNFATVGADTVKQAEVDAGTRIRNAIDTWHDSTNLERATNVGSSFVGVVNALFSPATGLIKTAETVPVLGTVAHAVNGIFGAIGAVGGTGAAKVVDKLPISQKTKETIKPLVSELGALAAQIATGKAVAEHPAIKAKIADLSKQVVTHVEADAVAPKKGLAGLLQKAQKSGEVVEAKAPVVTEPVAVPKITDKMKELPKVEKKVEEPVKKSPESTIKEPVGGNTVSGVAKNIESKAVEKKLTEGYDEDVAKYSATTFKEQSEHATKLVNDDIEQARRIVRGEETLPEGLREAPLVAAMEEYALKNPEKAGDIYHELAKSNLASEVSLSGQGLSLARLRDTNSPTYVLKDVQKTREEKVQKKLKGKSVKQVKKEETEAIKKEMKKHAPKKEDWDTFIKNLTCGVE